MKDVLIVDEKATMLARTLQRSDMSRGGYGFDAQEQQDGKEAYKALKGEWKSMINLLIDKGARAMDDKSLRELLDSITGQYPEFLKEGE